MPLVVGRESGPATKILEVQVPVAAQKMSRVVGWKPVMEPVPQMGVQALVVEPGGVGPGKISGAGVFEPISATPGKAGQRL